MRCREDGRHSGDGTSACQRADYRAKVVAWHGRMDRSMYTLVDDISWSYHARFLPTGISSSASGGILNKRVGRTSCYSQPTTYILAILLHLVLPICRLPPHNYTDVAGILHFADTPLHFHCILPFSPPLPASLFSGDSQEGGGGPPASCLTHTIHLPHLLTTLPACAALLCHPLQIFPIQHCRVPLFQPPHTLFCLIKPVDIWDIP